MFEIFSFNFSKLATLFFRHILIIIYSNTCCLSVVFNMGNKSPKIKSEDIFNAARDGNISKLKAALDHKPEGQVRTFVSSTMNHDTPLIVACRNGHIDVVLYLLEKCQADIEQSGCVNGWKPMFYAVISGNLNMVKALIEHGAEVHDPVVAKHPLVSACEMGHFEIVKYLVEHGADINLTGNGKGYTSCLSFACENGHHEIAEYLLECGAEVNSKDDYGDTGFHACVRSDNLEIAKMLLQHGASMSLNLDGRTPLLHAATLCSIAFVEYFIEHCNCSKQDKVNALELLGATFVDMYRDMMAARSYWRRAMHLRYEDGASRLEKPTDKSPLSSRVSVTEVCTFDQLDKLTDDEMEIQALVVRERILGPSHFLSIRYIRYRAKTYAEIGNFEKCIQFWVHVLDEETGIILNGELDRLERGSGCVIYENFPQITKLFYKMMSVEGDFENSSPAVSFWDIINVFDCALKLIETDLDECLKDCVFTDLLNISMQLLILMCRLRPHFKLNEEKSLKQAAHNLVRINPKGEGGFTVLHIFISTHSVCTVSSHGLIDNDENSEENGFIEQSKVSEFGLTYLEVVNLLLEVGACPNARDSFNNTPLHAAAMNRPSATDVFDTLLRQGAHIDLYNDENKTPLQLLDDVSLLYARPLQHLNLQCLCAQAIVKHKIPYKGLMPKKLCEFIDMHGLSESM